MSPNEDTFWLTNGFGEHVKARMVTPTAAEKEQNKNDIVYAVGMRRTLSAWTNLGFYKE